MKKIDFKKIYIQNFLSIGNEPLEVEFQNGVNVINGINRDEEDIGNAVGKSSIIDAFYYVLFGTTLRELSKTSFIVNRKNGKNCIVRLEFDITDSTGNRHTYLLERKIAPQSLKIWKDNNEITKSTTAETNKFVEELLSADKDIFQNCIVMRANNNVPFMAKKKTEKKNFIEAIFNLNIFSLMTKYLKDDIKDVKGRYSLETNSLNLHQNNLIGYNKQLDDLVELQKDLNENLQRDIDELNNKIVIEESNKQKVQTVLISEREKLPSSGDEIRNQLKSCNEMLSKLNQMRNKISVDAGILRKDLERLNSSSGICPTCGQEYPENYKCEVHNKKNEISEKLKTYSSQLELISEKYDETDKEKETLNEQLSSISKVALSIQMLENKIKECERFILLYKEQIIQKQQKPEVSGIDNFKKLIEETQIKLEKVQNEVSFLEKELGKMNICEHILGEYGVRAYVVNQLLDLFNSRIQHYLQSIKSTFYFRFNEYFEEEIKDSNGIICQYANCSGAEMKKIDLAISFAINDMLNLQKQISYNVIFFDEILDSSVDDKSLNIILNFISEYTQKENKSVYIISHKSGAQIPFINEVITLEKVNGFTKRIIN
jgi:DNA repair exonuclease SbcCD ATPase subunit